MGKDDATWLNVSYVIFMFLSAYVFYKAVEMAGIQFALVERYDWFTFAATGISVVAGAAVMVALRSSTERNEYYLASIGELRKVTWPSWADTKRMTIVVAVVVGFFSVVLSVFDVLWSRLLKMLIA